MIYLVNHHQPLSGNKRYPQVVPPQVILICKPTTCWELARIRKSRIAIYHLNQV